VAARQRGPTTAATQVGRDAVLRVRHGREAATPKVDKHDPTYGNTPMGYLRQIHS
jgi:hypothetical protein